MIELPTDSILTLTRVESRMLDIPLDEGDFDLKVLPRQTRAFAQRVTVFERRGASNIPADEISPRAIGYGARSHSPIVRLHVERRTKLDQKSHTGDKFFDLQRLRDFKGSSAFLRPKALTVFAPETIDTLVLLSDRSLELHAAVDWDAVETKPEEQR